MALTMNPAAASYPLTCIDNQEFIERIVHQPVRVERFRWVEISVSCPSPVHHIRSNSVEGTRQFETINAVKSFARICALWLALNLGCQRSSYDDACPAIARIAGSSMEPTLLGPQKSSFCRSCQACNRFSEESIVGDNRVTCPRCGFESSCDTWQAGMTVAIDPIVRSAIRRSDLVVVRDRDSIHLEVKRVVGLPHESVVVIDGDLWINGNRFQKSISQFLSQAIVVERWPAIEMRLAVEAEPSRRDFAYQSYSLWPRIGEKLQPHPSPILDEYRGNAAESRQLVAVRDIGLQLKLAELPSLSTRIEIKLWVDDAIRCIPIALSSDGIHIQSSFTAIYFVPWDASTLPIVNAVMVDGRILVGTAQQAVSLNLADYAASNSGNHTAAACSSTTPIVLSLFDGIVSIENASIVRDIHYRGPHGEVKFELPALGGFHVLGDNVSNSFDSRQRWPNGVSSDIIVGKVTRELRVTPELVDR